MEWELSSILVSFRETKTTNPPDRGEKPGLATSSRRRPALQNPEQLRLCFFSPLMSGCLQVVVAAGGRVRPKGPVLAGSAWAKRRRPRVSVCVSAAAAGPCRRGGPEGAWVAPGPVCDRLRGLLRPCYGRARLRAPPVNASAVKGNRFVTLREKKKSK